MPPPLAQFIAEHPTLDCDRSSDEIFLYYGTSCYRRWEINRTGFIEPGLGRHSLFYARREDAYQHGRKVCLEDARLRSINSLTSEAVVLKVRFDARVWLQVDAVAKIEVPDEDGSIQGLVFTVLGPVNFSNIKDVLYCTHNRRLAHGEPSCRSFENGTLFQSIRDLRFKFVEKRLDAWLLKQLCRFTRRVEVELAGGAVPGLTLQDDLRRLKQLQVKT